MTGFSNTQATAAGQEPVDNSEGARAALPPRMDQGLFWQDVRQGLLWTATFVAVGGGAVFFLTLPRPAQAMLIYLAIVTGCASLILASLRRKARGR